MTADRWDEIKDMVKGKFKVLEEDQEPLILKTGSGEEKKIGDKEVLIFSGPMGKTKLEFISKPVVLDKIEHYSKRAGTSSTTEYVLSDSEFVYRLEVFVDSGGEWEKVDASMFENL